MSRLIYNFQNFKNSTPTHFHFPKKYFPFSFFICFHICHNSKLSQTYLPITTLKIFLTKIYIIKLTIFLPSHMFQKFFWPALVLDFLQPIRNIKIKLGQIDIYCTWTKLLFKFGTLFLYNRKKSTNTGVIGCDQII